MIELISYLRRMFKEIVSTSDWMDEDTKTAALLKVLHVDVPVRRRYHSSGCINTTADRRYREIYVDIFESDRLSKY